MKSAGRSRPQRSICQVAKTLDVAERAEYISEGLGRVMRKNREEYARLVTEEMGKPIRQSLAEIEKCAWVCDYYAEHAEIVLA